MMIKSKLLANSVLVVIGLLIILGDIYFALNTLEVEYSKTNKIQTEASHLKSIMIGGLMFNSAKGVVDKNINATKAIKTMSGGVKKVDGFYAKLDKSISNTLEDKVNAFNTIANTMISDAKNKKAFQSKDMKNSLKAWRNLKSTVLKKLKTLKKEVAKLKKGYVELVSSTIRNTIIITLIIAIIIFIISTIISRSISIGLKNIIVNTQALKDSNDVSSRIKVDSKDELLIIASNLNEYLDGIEQGIKEDAIFIKDTQVVMEKLSHGWFSQHIEVNTNNPALIELKQTINGAINKLKDLFLDINGILKQYVKLDYRNELKIDNIEKGGVFDHLISDVNKLRQAINDMLIDNKQNGLTLDDSSDLLLKNVDMLNRNSNSAAAALEETAAALEEVTSNITSNTENVIKMSGYANQLTSSAQEGQNLAKQTTTAMNEIDEQVNAINDAISVIDQIAFQTNILSLNAAVEAATAGEAGKGFAVVAQEVRNLASRSAEAANEIKSLVENATNKANEGKKISDKMILGYDGLNENITKTIDLISDVEIASKEQQKGIEQINDAVTALDQQTQQIASIASQTNDIAVQTDDIAKLIVQNANEKEFIGKETVESKSEEAVKQVHNQVEHPTHTISQSTNKSKPSTIPTQTITASNDADEWESF